MKVLLVRCSLLITFLACLLSTNIGLGQQLVINEVMASNATTIADEDGDFEDWIELYNGTDETINLEGFGLSDDFARPFRWVFPTVSIEPGQFLLLWASGKDRKDAEGALHTNFSISSSGEPIILTDPLGSRIDLIDDVPIPRDVSYGRFSDGSPNLYFFATPTPGEPNDAEIYTGILDDLSLSVVPLTENTYQVILSHPDPEATILYALDGEDPLSGGNVYEDTLTLIAESENALMFIRTVPIDVAVSNYGWIRPKDEFEKGLTIRAAAVKTGYRSSPIVGRTLFSNLPNFPVVAISVNNDDFFDDSVGIYVPGLIYERNGFNWSNPWGYPNANYHQDGAQWERPISVEFIYPDEQYHARELGVRIHGSGSRALPQKSLRLYARPTNGGDVIDFDVFQNGKSGYRRLILRTSGQDAVYQTTLFRDAVIHRIFGHMGMEDQLAQPVLVYINGEFWGLHNVRERFDVHYLERRFGVDPNLIDYLEFDGAVKEGDSDHYYILRNHLINNDMSDDENMAYAETLMDVDNYINYQVAQIYASNYDWPGNNIEYWRSKKDFSPNEGPGKDGRWRWVFKDIDSGFGMHDPPGYTYDMLSHSLETNGPSWPNPPWSTQFLRSLLNNNTFKRDFINRFCDEMNTGLLPTRVTNLINEYANELAPFISDHAKRWGRPIDVVDWRTNVNTMIQYAQKRPDYQRKHLREYFGLEEEKEVTFDIYPVSAGVVKVNSKVIDTSTPGVGAFPYPWSGIYFSDVAIKVEALPEQGYTFSHWEGALETSDNPLIVLPSELNGALHAIFTSSVDGGDLIHYYHFNDLDNSANLTEVSPDFSRVKTSSITYPGAGSGYMDDVNDGTHLLAIPGVDPGRALRVRNPSQNRNLVFKVPSTGYGQLRFRYAAKRTNNGARQQAAFYRTSSDGTWQFLTDTLFITPDWQEYHLSLIGLDDVDNNADLEIMLRFLGDEAGNDSGNNRFDNVTLVGRPLKISPDTDPLLTDVHVFPNPAHDHITINAVAVKPLKAKIQLYDMAGKLIRDFPEADLLQGRNLISHHITPITSGQYILTILTGSQTFTKPIIVH